MNNAGFILAINLSMAGMLAAAFLAIASYNRTRPAGRWFALAFAVGMVNYLLEFALPFSGGSPLIGFSAYIAVAVSLAAFAVGLARHYDSEPPWSLMALLLAYATVAGILVLDMQRDTLARNMLYQSTYAGLQAVLFWIVWRAPRKALLDKALLLVLGVGALHFLLKPALAEALGGPGESAAAYAYTTYALVSQSLGAVLAVGAALLMLLILMRDALTQMTRKSETDPLSGLLNRGGFEDRLRAIIAETSARGAPVSLVLCDLDHFKAVNDTHGHATGDRVIAAFAARLTSASERSFAIGRIGGEEFAVALPGFNLAAARLFAENVRTGFASVPIEAVSETLRFSASFGVTEYRAGEPAAEAMERADQALYQAKKAGRDCVRASPPTEEQAARALSPSRARAG